MFNAYKIQHIANKSKVKRERKLHKERELLLLLSYFIKTFIVIVIVTERKVTEQCLFRHLEAYFQTLKSNLKNTEYTGICIKPAI